VTHQTYIDNRQNIQISTKMQIANHTLYKEHLTSVRLDTIKMEM